MKRILAALFMAVFLLALAGCTMQLTQKEDGGVIQPGQEAVNSTNPNGVVVPAITGSAENADVTSSETNEPEPETKPNEVMLADHLVKITETFKTPLWEVNALFVSMTIEGGSEELPEDYATFMINAFQDGVPLVFAVSPDFSPPQPGGSARLELIIQLESADGEVEVDLDKYQIYGNCALQLWLDEIESREQTIMEATIERFKNAAPLNTETRYVLPDQWPLGLPVYVEAFDFNLSPFISDHVDMPDGAYIRFAPFYNKEAMRAYVEKCVALGYVKSEERMWDDYNSYYVTLSGQAYSIRVEFAYYGDDYAFNSFDFTVKRIGK